MRSPGLPALSQLCKVFGEPAAFDIISAAMLEESESNDKRLEVVVENLYRTMDE